MTKEELIELLKEGLELKVKNARNYEGETVAIELSVWLDGEYITECWIGGLS